MLDGQDLPAVRLEALGDVLGERDVGVTVDGDVCVNTFAVTSQLTNAITSAIDAIGHRALED